MSAAMDSLRQLDREQRSLQKLAAEQPALELRVFILTPGDVLDEHHLILQLLERLNNESGLRGRLQLVPVTWDQLQGPQTGKTLDPDLAAQRSLLLPSQCDLVVMVFGGHLGTALPEHLRKAGNQPYFAMGEWLYLNALAGAGLRGRPQLWIYRRESSVPLNLNDPRLPGQRAAWARLGAFLRGINHPDSGHDRPLSYRYPGDLQLHLENRLRRLLLEYWRAWAQPGPRQAPLPPVYSNPYPGLRPFRKDEAMVFFGREREVDQLLQRLRDQHFVAVIGSSGAGKTSLVQAGLLARLEGQGLPGSATWVHVSFTPGQFGDDPFIALATALLPVLDKPGLKALNLASAFRRRPGKLAELLNEALSQRDRRSELLIVADSFEELFSLAEEGQQGPFIELLATLSAQPRLRVVITLRVDFYDRFLDWPRLAVLLRDGSFPVGSPDPISLHRIITGPARLADLEFEEGLVERLLEDTGARPTGLGSLAYCLSVLVRHSPDRLLRLRDYERLGGVQGAIETTATDNLSALGEAARDAIPDIFRSLVKVSPRGGATRHRVPLRTLSVSGAATRAVDQLLAAGLLTTSLGRNDQPLVEISHELLFRRWSLLDYWIEETANDLSLLQEFRRAVRHWQEQGRVSPPLWLHERMGQITRMLERLQPHLSPVERRFLNPEREFLLQELSNPTTGHQRRATIGDRLAELGDTRPGVGLDQDGLPEILWCRVDPPPGQALPPFRIARYPLTWMQYQAFLEAPDGFSHYRWWQGQQPDNPPRRRNRADNYPVDNVSWHDAMAFCRWLAHRLHQDIQLPTVLQWEMAATGGNPQRIYPWGEDWLGGHANTVDSGLGRTVAVGLYPLGRALCGAEDLCGNVWEWCLDGTSSSDDRRAARGGSWVSAAELGRTDARVLYYPEFRDRNVGFRLCCNDPLG